MDAVTLSNPKILALAKRFSCVKLNTSKNADDTAKLNLNVVPALIFYSSHEKEIQRLEGFLPPAKLEKIMHGILQGRTTKKMQPTKSDKKINVPKATADTKNLWGSSIAQAKTKALKLQKPILLKIGEKW